MAQFCARNPPLYYNEYSTDDDDYLTDELNNINLVDNIDEKIGKVVIKCTYSYRFRIAMEILSIFVVDGILRFSKDKIHVSHQNGDGDISVLFEFPTEKLLYYEVDYPATTAFDYPIAKIVLKTFINNLKIINKKDFTHLIGDILSDGYLEYLNIQKSSDNIGHIECNDNEGISEDDYTNYFDKYYKNEAPTSKITVFKFSDFIAAFKSGGCIKSVFKLKNNGSIVVEGIKDNRSFNMFMFESANVNENLIKPGLAPISDICSISVNYKSNNSWISKLNKLTDGNSIVCIYLKEDAPLIIRMPVGDIGISTFTFTNTKSV